MQVFGLTGNTGTGKTAVAGRLKERGLPVVDADAIAHAIVALKEPALAEIAAAFGAEFVDANGALRRQALGRVVFGDPSARRRLEAITHPRIAAEAMRQIQALAAEGEARAVYDSALIVESGQAPAFAGLIVVTATRAQQCERIMARDGLSREDALQRIDAQMPLAEKVALADYVVDNSGSVEALDHEVEALLQWILERAG